MFCKSYCWPATFLLVWVCGVSAAALLKVWDVREDGNIPRWDAQKSGPFEQAILQRLQNYYEADNGGQWMDSNSNIAPNKRQIRYHQCYFNPISCFRRRK